jgi:hypothetical protein
MKHQRSKTIRDSALDSIFFLGTYLTLALLISLFSKSFITIYDKLMLICAANADAVLAYFYSSIKIFLTDGICFLSFHHCNYNNNSEPAKVRDIAQFFRVFAKLDAEKTSFSHSKAVLIRKITKILRDLSFTSVYYRYNYRDVICMGTSCTSYVVERKFK